MLLPVLWDGEGGVFRHYSYRYLDLLDVDDLWIKQFNLFLLFKQFFQTHLNDILNVFHRFLDGVALSVTTL